VDTSSSKRNKNSIQTEQDSINNASLLDSASNTWFFKTGSFKYEDYTMNKEINISQLLYLDSKIDHWKGQGDLLESSYDSIGNETSQLIKNWMCH
jgi:hypothetical protein